MGARGPGVQPKPGRLMGTAHSTEAWVFQGEEGAGAEAPKHGCVCVLVCVHAGECACICVGLYTCACVLMRVCVRACMHVSVCVCGWASWSRQGLVQVRFQETQLRLQNLYPARAA